MLQLAFVKRRSGDPRGSSPYLGGKIFCRFFAMPVECRHDRRVDRHRPVLPRPGRAVGFLLDGTSVIAKRREQATPFLVNRMRVVAILDMKLADELGVVPLKERRGVKIPIARLIRLGGSVFHRVLRGQFRAGQWRAASAQAVFDVARTLPEVRRTRLPPAPHRQDSLDSPQ